MELQPGRRQYVHYNFFKVQPEWRRLSEDTRERHKAEFQGVIERWSEHNLVRSYSLIGTRGDTDFLVWQVSYELDDIHHMSAELLGTEFAGYLETPYSYLSMTKHSTYVEKYSGPGGDRATRLSLAPGQHKYLFVYPMVKMREWYSLAKEERQEAMNQHMAVGATYDTVKINTTYSFGLDDQEFVVAFESDFPGDFLDLVQELRPSISSAYTKEETPIFTCIAMSAREMLDSLTGRRAAVPA